MKKVLALILIAVAAMVMLYVGMPVIAYGFWGLPIGVAALTMIWIALTTNVIPQYNAGVQTFKLKSGGKITTGVLVILFLYSTILPMLTSMPLLHTSEYRNLIGTVEIGENLSTHMAPISMEKVRVVDQSLANILGDKVLGAQPALGSQVRLGQFNIQKVNSDENTIKVNAVNEQKEGSESPPKKTDESLKIIYSAENDLEDQIENNNLNPVNELENQSSLRNQDISPCGDFEKDTMIDRGTKTLEKKRAKSGNLFHLHVGIRRKI